MISFRNTFAALLLLLAVPAFADVTGTVIDATGTPLHGATVTLRAGAVERVTLTGAGGTFRFQGDFPEDATLTVEFASLEPVTRRLGKALSTEIVIDTIPLAEQIVVQGRRPERRVSSAMKSEAPLREIPQSVTVIDEQIIEEQNMQALSDVVRYVPGVAMAQGEGNRDAAVFRGNATTADFFVDGFRDDVQYFRDLYNVQQVEAITGPNAMIFGRGGAGGVLNRVTRRAGGEASEIDLQVGSWSNKRITADFGRSFTELFASRVTAVYEDSDTYRDGVFIERYGINPTAALNLGGVDLHLGYELFHDERTADRGIPSFAGRPVPTASSTFFGDPDDSRSDATVHRLSATTEYNSGDTSIRGRISFADYDKFYQNVYPSAVVDQGASVRLSAYNNATQRENLFGQLDVTRLLSLGGLDHTITGGVEAGRQATDNFRSTGYFAADGGETTSFFVPLSNPVSTVGIDFRQSATDADNDGVATILGLYAQDQIEFSPRWKAVLGLRFDRFGVDFHNRRNGQTITTEDNVVSPRAGVIFTPMPLLSLYGSYSMSYVPRAGEQLSSLSLTTASLEPETFRNYEVGAKWDIHPSLGLTAALYRLDRGNIAVADPGNTGQLLLVDGQRTEGFEVGLSGRMNSRWSAIGQYTYMDARITESLSSSAIRGARLPHVPEHSISLWSRYDVTSRWGFGAGAIHQTESYASTDNSVVLPGFTRVDGAIFFDVTPRVQAQLNVENLLDTDYYAFAHNNNNITPGAPRTVRLSWSTRF